MKTRKPPKTAIKNGEVRNPNGANGFSTGLQPYTKRAEHYLDKFKPSEILEIAADMKRLDKFPSWDAIVLKRLAACIKSETKEERQEVEALLNRKEGKPTENKTIRVINSAKDLTQEELEKLASYDET